jgi:hypothetical protein
MTSCLVRFRNIIFASVVVLCSISHVLSFKYNQFKHILKRKILFSGSEGGLTIDPQEVEAAKQPVINIRTLKFDEFSNMIYKENNRVPLLPASQTMDTVVTLNMKQVTKKWAEYCKQIGKNSDDTSTFDMMDVISACMEPGKWVQIVELETSFNEEDEEMKLEENKHNIQEVVVTFQELQRVYNTPLPDDTRSKPETYPTTHALLLLDDEFDLQLTDPSQLIEMDHEQDMQPKLIPLKLTKTEKATLIKAGYSEEALTMRSYEDYLLEDKEVQYISQQVRKI